MLKICQYLAPQRALSRLCGWGANSRLAWVKNGIIKQFIRRYPVNMAAAIETDPFAYASFNDFFTRQLKPELRPLPADEQVICSPVDGSIYQIGECTEPAITAKGRGFTVAELLGDKALAEPFRAGQFITCYLHPTDYHRVHMPYTGQLRKMIYIPGKLFSVQPKIVQQIPNLFARNERVVCFFDTDRGPMAVVLVGAMIVGSISIAWHGTVAPGQQLQGWDTKITVQRGEELGYFSLGSTVIVLWGGDKLQWKSTVRTDAKVLYGQGLVS